MDSVLISASLAATTRLIVSSASVAGMSNFATIWSATSFA